MRKPFRSKGLVAFGEQRSEKYWGTVWSRWWRKQLQSSEENAPLDEEQFCKLPESRLFVWVRPHMEVVIINSWSLVFTAFRDVIVFPGQKRVSINRGDVTTWFPPVSCGHRHGSTLTSVLVEIEETAHRTHSQMWQFLHTTCVGHKSQRTKPQGQKKES